MIPVEKNKEYIAVIDGVTSEGNGVCHIDGFAVFVPMTAKGDKVRVLIVKVKSGYAYGKMTELIEPSPMRAEPVCLAFRRCGGCQMMHIKYDEQLRIKADTVNDALQRIGGISDYEFDGIIGMDEPYSYRNKMIFPIGYDKDGRLRAGFYANRSHDIVPLDECVLGSDICTHVIRKVTEFAEKYNISAYDEKSHSGVLRRIFIRSSKKKNQHMVVISVNGKKLDYAEELVKMLTEGRADIAGVLLNINTKRTNLVLGDKNIQLFGDEKLTDDVCGNSFEISVHSFFQVNPVQTEKLYSAALEYADISKSDRVMDIYCGIGTISLACAKQAAHVTGVEIVPQAIADAKRNATQNGIKNTDFYAADAAELVPQLIKNGEMADIVILDPPRKGSDEKTLTAIIKAAPKRIVYVSCNPATLARDLKFLQENGYRTERVKAVDMFPHTSHVETVVLLQRQNT